jgi:O-antigen/teichoic acid export membrane protein
VTDTTAQFKTQLPRNLFLQILSFTVQIGLGLWLVPYLVSRLGRAAYGLTFIAGMMTQYVGLISFNISSSVTRFLTMALQQGDTRDANRTFNTAFFSYLAIAVIQIPVFGFVIYCANTIFTIPQDLHRDAVMLLTCSAVGFIINLLSSVFGVPIYANNRLDIYRSIDIARQIFRPIGIVLLFLLWGPRLRYVGYVDLVISTVSCLATITIGRRLAPILKLSVRAYDWSKVRQLTGMGAWLFVNQVGSLLFLRVDIWVCNRFVSPEGAGDYAAILQWSNLIRQAGTLLTTVTAPMILIYYARSEIERLVRLSEVSVRVLCLLLAIPISILCVFSPALLCIWLGRSFVGLWPLMVIMVCHLSINVGVMPLFNIQVAVNKVRWPGIVTVVMGAVNLALAIFLAKCAGLGIYGVAIAGAIILTAKNALFTPIYGAVILHRPWHTFLKSTVSGLFLMAGFTMTGLLLARHVHPGSWPHLALTCLASGVIGLSAVWLVMSKRDRQLMVDMIPTQLRSALTRIVPV